MKNSNTVPSGWAAPGKPKVPVTDMMYPRRSRPKPRPKPRKPEPSRDELIELAREQLYLLVEDREQVDAFINIPEIFDAASETAMSMFDGLDNTPVSNDTLIVKCKNAFRETQLLIRWLLDILSGDLETDEIDRLLNDSTDGILVRLPKALKVIQDEDLQEECKRLISEHVPSVMESVDDKMDKLQDDMILEFEGRIIPTLEAVAECLEDPSRRNGRGIESIREDAEVFTLAASDYMNARLDALNVMGISEEEMLGLIRGRERVWQSFTKAKNKLKNKTSFADKAKVVRSAHQEYLGLREMIDAAMSASAPDQILTPPELIRVIESLSRPKHELTLADANLITIMKHEYDKYNDECLRRAEEAEAALNDSGN